MLQLTLLEREEVELEYTTFSIVEQLSRVISTQENQAILKDIEIVFEKPRKDITINGDEQRLEQVWINIISNAIKYTDNGGLITIKVKRLQKKLKCQLKILDEECLKKLFLIFLNVFIVKIKHEVLKVMV